MDKVRIAITGMGAITPVGLGVSAYWRGLLSGISGVNRISRFGPVEMPVQIAAEVKNFYPADFMPKKLTTQTDIFMQYVIAAAHEALQDSKLSAAPERVAIVVGTALAGITTAAQTQEQIMHSGSLRVTPHLVPKMLGNIAAAHIGILHGFKGPSYTVNTACASGADAIGLGMMLLASGQADAVVAAGGDSILNPLMIAGLSSARALSVRNDNPARASRPFDLHRDGFVIGEGGGAVVLERLEEADRRGADIKAELLGYANCTDAYHVTSPEPDGSGEIACMQKAMTSAGVAASSIGYVNAHGTSTPLGDKIETKALKAVLGDQAARIPISSTKGATGHLMGAGGVTELIACIQSIREGVVPPTINYEVPDPECDLDVVPNQARPSEVRIAMSNSFGFGGQNATLIVGKYDGQ